MQVVYSESHRGHHPRHFLVNGTVQQCPEVPARADAFLAAYNRLAPEAERKTVQDLTRYR